MAYYEFETDWRLRAPLLDVWNAIAAPDRWPQWWDGVVAAELVRPGNGQGIGAVRRLTWRSRLPYTLTFDVEVARVEPMALIEGRATGELEGTGTWRLASDGDLTSVHYSWHVRTTRPWMNLLAPLLRPVFRWNHDYVMARGGEGLARLLGTQLVEAREPGPAP